jgi:hypothetical protein
MQETRAVEFPKVGYIVRAVPLEIVMAVWLQDELGPVVPAVELGVPLPVMVIPMFLGTLMPLDQVHDPAGIWITSPSTAICEGPLMTAFTSLWLQVAAV